MAPCRYCKRQFEQTKFSFRGSFCSETCRTSFYHSALVPFVCEDCGVSNLLTKAALGYRKRRSRYPNLCKECIRLKTDNAGAKNGMWRGGHAHWSPGRHGKDKDGLSWKTQRRAAWERDGATCQHCHTKKNRKPDVHHVVPFRISQSHALDNLLCLCQSCHLTEEAKVQEQWGGQLTDQHRTAPRPRCSECKNPKCKITHGTLCAGCYRTTVLKPRAIALHTAGFSGSEIARQLGYTPQAINLWLRNAGMAKWQTPWS